MAEGLENEEQHEEEIKEETKEDLEEDSDAAEQEKASDDESEESSNVSSASDTQKRRPESVRRVGLSSRRSGRSSRRLTDEEKEVHRRHGLAIKARQFRFGAGVVLFVGFVVVFLSGLLPLPERMEDFRNIRRWNPGYLQIKNAVVSGVVPGKHVSRRNPTWSMIHSAMCRYGMALAYGITAAFAMLFLIDISVWMGRVLPMLSWIAFLVLILLLTFLTKWPPNTYECYSEGYWLMTLMFGLFLCFLGSIMRVPGASDFYRATFDALKNGDPLPEHSDFYPEAGEPGEGDAEDTEDEEDHSDDDEDEEDAEDEEDYSDDDEDEEDVVDDGDEEDEEGDDIEKIDDDEEDREDEGSRK